VLCDNFELAAHSFFYYSLGEDVLNNLWTGLTRGHVDDCRCSSPSTLTAICTQCRDSYVWSDGSSMDYQDGWSATSEPGEDYCTKFTSDGWSAEPCDTLLQSVCERGAFLHLIVHSIAFAAFLLAMFETLIIVRP